MNDIYERRRRNLVELTKEHGKKTDLATRLDMTAAQVSHWLRDPGLRGARQIKEDSARQIERALRMPVGALDKDPDGASTPRAAPVAPSRKEIDADLLAKTTRAVLLEVQNIKGKPMIDKIADIVQLAYQHNSGFGSLDENYIHQLVKLMH